MSAEKTFDHAEEQVKRIAASIVVPQEVFGDHCVKRRRQTREAAFAAESFQKVCERIEKRLVKLVREEQKRVGDRPLVEIERNPPLPEVPYDLFLIQRPQPRMAESLDLEVRVHVAVLQDIYLAVIRSLRTLYKYIKWCPSIKP